MAAQVELTIEQMREARRQAVASSSSSSHTSSSATAQAANQQQQYGLVEMDEDTIESINTVIRDAPKNARLFYARLLREVCLYTPDENFNFNPVTYIKTLPPYTWLRVRGPVVENGGRHWILAVFDKVSQHQQQQPTHVSDDWFKIQEFFVLVKDDKGKVNMSRPVMEVPSAAFGNDDANAFSLERFLEKPTMPDVVQAHKVDHTNESAAVSSTGKKQKQGGKKSSSREDEDEEDDAESSDDASAKKKRKKKPASNKKSKKSKQQESDDEDDDEEEEDEDGDEEEAPSGWLSWLPRFGGKRD
jgi:hypothetical protein